MSRPWSSKYPPYQPWYLLEVHKQSRRFLHWWKSFLTHGIEELVREALLLDLILTNKEELIKNVKFKGSLGCSYYEKEELQILWGKNTAKSKMTTLDFSSSDSALFRHLLEWIPQRITLEGRGIQESWLIFKDHFIQAQDLATPTNRKTCKDRRRPAWMNLEPDRTQTWKWSMRRWTTERWPGKIQRLFKHIAMMSLSWICWGTWRARESATAISASKGIPSVLLLSGEGEMATEHTKKAKVPSALFALVLAGNTRPLGIPGPWDKWERKTCPWWRRVRIGNTNWTYKYTSTERTGWCHCDAPQYSEGN